MNDFEYDCLQKKRLARQAKYRKRGSRSKKCSLSSDFMTQKQWLERCGAVLSVNLNQPVSWDVFKELGKKTQEEYIGNLMKIYSVNATSLAAMFHVQPLTVRRFIQAKRLNLSFPVGRSMNAEQKAAWESFLDGKGVPSGQSPPENTEVEMANDTDCEMNMRHVSLSFSGKIDVSAISNSLRHILGNDMVGEIEIICNLA